MLQLLRLCRFDDDDGTIRSYAAACLQNASSFLELFDPERISHQEESELRSLSADSDANIAAPAQHVLANVEQIYAYSQIVGIELVGRAGGNKTADQVVSEYRKLAVGDPSVIEQKAERVYEVLRQSIDKLDPEEAPVEDLTSLPMYE